jgi:hypothetical protein
VAVSAPASPWQAVPDAAATSVSVSAETAGGDPEGTGSAMVAVTGDRLCSTINVSGIQLPATGAHIHVAPAGQDGPVVVTLAAPDQAGASSGCLSGLDPGLLAAIAATPEQYYVNVHTEEFPGGAVRGHLD